MAALRSHPTTTASGLRGFTQGQLPGGQGQLPNGQLPGQFQGQGQGQGGFADVPGDGEGEQRVSGAVTEVGAASVTIHTAGGTTTYAVTAQTEIVRNGARASLSSVRPGDSVFVHLIPGSGSSYVLERLFAQSSGSASNGAGQPNSTGNTT